jgi:hypothetical protein
VYVRYRDKKLSVITLRFRAPLPVYGVPTAAWRQRHRLTRAKLSILFLTGVAERYTYPSQISAAYIGQLLQDGSLENNVSLSVGPISLCTIYERRMSFHAMPLFPDSVGAAD